MSILKLIVGAILRFFWDRADEWYQQEVRYQQNKRVLIQEVKDVARQAADANEAIVVERESIDDSLLRLERVVVKREAQPGQPDPQRVEGPIFGAAFTRREGRDSEGDTVELSQVPVSDSTDDSENPGDQRSESE